MTDKELWHQMENFSNEEQTLEKEMKFMLLLKKAYDKDMKLIMACIYNPSMPGMTRQSYKDLLLQIMPGEKPKPEFYRE